MGITPNAWAGSAVIGWLDGVTVHSDGTITVRGWAATSDSPTAHIGVRVLIDGHHSLLSFKVGNDYRPDVPAVIGSKYSSYLGYTKTVPAPSGTHTVCVEGQNNGVYNVLSGCRTYSMGGFPSGALRRLWGGNYVVTPGTLLSKGFSLNGGSTSMRDAFTAGANSWNSSPAWVSFSNTGVTATSTDVYIADVPYSWYGLTTAHPCPATASLDNVVLECSYSWSRIDMNTSTISNTAQMQKSGAHELGHSIGLSHPPSGTFSVMTQGSVGDANVSTTPSTYDVGSSDILYPRSYFGE